MSRLRVGMRVLVREGSTERNVDALIGGVLKLGCSTENLCFCTDDKHAGEIMQEGHINYNVRRAIALGIEPMQAIQMASINAARHFRIDDEVGSITPGRLADILLVDDLTKMEPKAVYFEGTLVAENKRLLQACRVSDYPDWIKDTVHFKKPITAASFRCFSKDPKAKETTAHVIGLIDVQIINHDLIRTLPVDQGEIQRDLSQDILKLAVVERYGKTGGVGVGFVQGFTLKKGALAYSMSHDHHNIVTVGVSDSDMAVAVNEVARLHGGLAVVCDGNVMDSMCLPIGGLMSECGADEVMRLLDGMNEAARQLGCQTPAPFMTLSFISLPTVPELGLTDMGLVDVLGHRLIDVETQDND